jgi:subtilisin family serine protease
VVNAINQAIHDNIDIISMSFALGSASSELQQKVKEASEKKIILIASSGNEGLNTDRFPSCYKECQCIGAINRVKNQTNYTSFPRKKNLDFLAPGDDIYSTYLSPQWTSLNGTSMSAAFVSGVVALLLAWTKKNKPDLNNSDVMDALKTSVDTANINKSGCGIINPNAALQILKNK